VNSYAADNGQLSAAPRKVPGSFRLAELLPFQWSYLWILFFVGLAPAVIWFAHPVLFAIAAVITLAAIYASRFRATRTRLALLRWGRVATVTGSQLVATLRSYSGRTWFNGYAPVAQGWTVTRDPASLPRVQTRVDYTLDGYRGELMLTGREYSGGVVLADQRNPASALCVSDFPYDLARDGSGDWVGTLRPWLRVGMAAWLVVVLGWLALAALAV